MNGSYSLENRRIISIAKIPAKLQELIRQSLGQALYYFYLGCLLGRHRLTAYMR
jgi:hypothetical protein